MQFEDESAASRRALLDLRCQFVAQEVIASVRHTLINRVTGLGALASHLKRKLEAEAPTTASAPWLVEVLEEINHCVVDTGGALETGFLPPPLVSDVDPAGEIREAAAIAGMKVSLLREQGFGNVRLARDDFRVALQCLVENACDAVKGQADGWIEARLAMSTDGIRWLSITDNGPGMNDDIREHAFDPRFSTKTGRLGFGLCIARRAAGRWGGQVSLRPRSDGPGTTALLGLPRT